MDMMPLVLQASKCFDACPCQACTANQRLTLELTSDMRYSAGSLHATAEFAAGQNVGEK